MASRKLPSFREIGARLKSELAFYKRVLSHPKTPRISKVLLGGAIAYFLTPIDLIPDFIPIVGHLDDLVIVPGLIWLALRFIPSEVIAFCRQISPRPLTLTLNGDRLAPPPTGPFLARRVALV